MGSAPVFLIFVGNIPFLEGWRCLNRDVRKVTELKGDLSSGPRLHQAQFPVVVFTHSRVAGIERTKTHGLTQTERTQEGRLSPVKRGNQGFTRAELRLPQVRRRRA